MLIINKASAGSGKTFTLVKEYLIMLLGKKEADGSYSLDKHPNDNHRFILAITFTNKATEEMKKRIVEKLDELATTPDKSPYIADLMKTFGASKADISHIAGIAEYQLLDDYTNFNVSTIDTFFQKILRTFAYEVNLAGNYGVELNDDYVVELGVGNLKTALHNDAAGSHLGEWLWRYIKDSMKSGKSWNVFSLPKGPGKSKADDSLYNFAKALTKEVVKQNGAALFGFLQNPDNLLNFNTALEKAIEKESIKAKSLSLQALRLLDAPGVKPNSYLVKLLQKIADGPVPLNQRDKVDTITKKKEKIVNAKSAPVDETEICDIIDQINDAHINVESYSMILKYTYQLGLLGDIKAGVQDFTNENNTILLSGTNDIVKRIIDGCETPFIYERLGMYLHNFLLDEFQDTSRMQWQNLLPLVRNGIANGHDSLIIGDVKQSIYRFRNSDPQLLHSQLDRDFTTDEIKKNEGHSTNWRSARNIVEWNNAFFKFLSDNLELKDYYEDVEQEVAPDNKSLPGHVIISLTPPPEKKPEDEATTDDDDDDVSEWAMEKMVADILSLRERGYQQREIAILFNKNKEGQCAISQITKWNIANPDRKIKVVSEESLLMSSSPAVKIVVNILSMLDRCETRDEGGDELPMIMRSYEVNRSNGMEAAEAFEQAIANRDTETAAYVERLYAVSKSACLDSVVEQIVKSQLTEEMAAENTPYLLAFLDAVTDFMGRYGSNVHQFMKWWDGVGCKMSISSPDNIDAVRIITIHKSKGLEFPCVIIPKFDWDFDNKGLEWIPTEKIADKLPQDVAIPPIIAVKRTTRDSIFDEEFKKISESNTMDSLNKTYVACTRAQYELIIYTAEKKPLGKCVDGFIQSGLIPSEKPDDAEEQTIYELGKPTRRSEIPDLNKEVVKDSMTENRMMPPFRVVSDADRWKLTSPDIIIDVRNTPKWIGNTLHSIMERVRTPKDVDHALKRAFHRGIITEEELDRFSEQLGKSMKDPRVAEWFADDNLLMLERKITTGGKDFKRPDRVVMKPNGEITIIDYKFGERDDETDARYAKQVNGYKKALCDAMGCDIGCVSGYIWYVLEGDIVAV